MTNNAPSIVLGSVSGFITGYVTIDLPEKFIISLVIAFCSGVVGYLGKIFIEYIIKKIKSKK